MFGGTLSIEQLRVGASAAEMQAAVITAYESGFAKQSERTTELSRALGIAEVTINGFLSSLKETRVPLDKAPAKFQELAFRYLQLIDDVRALQSEDPEVQELRTKAR